VDDDRGPDQPPDLVAYPNPPVLYDNVDATDVVIPRKRATQFRQQYPQVFVDGVGIEPI